MLSEKNIKCPSCNQSLKVQNKKLVAAKVIQCPKCGASITVNFKEEHVPTVQPIENPEETPTILGPGVMKKISAYLDFNGYHYSLEKDENIIGRKATTSHADVQIDCNDPYMGRHHALISQRSTPMGINFCIKPQDAKNGLSVNNIPIGEYDEITLMDGSQIRMGRTVLTFKLNDK